MKWFVIIMLLAMVLIAGCIQQNVTNQEDYPTHPPISLNGTNINGSSISVNVSSSFYIHYTNLSIQGANESMYIILFSVSPPSGYPGTFIGNVSVVFNGLMPYSTYRIILSGETSPCSSPSAPSNCMDPSTQVFIVKNITTSSSGTTSILSINIPPFA